MKRDSLTSVGLLGSGTCRLSDRAAQNSAYVRCSSKELLLIDVGGGVPARVAALNLLEGVTTLHIHLSHLHIDHLMGVFALLQGIAWSDDARERGIQEVVLRCTQQVGDIFNDIVKSLGPTQIGLGDCPSASKYDLELVTYPNESDWDFEISGNMFHSVHLPSAFNHGLRFTLHGKRYAFACDATTYTPSLIGFFQNADIGVFDCGHLTNSWDPQLGWQFDVSVIIQLAIETQTPVLIATHHYLRQHQDIQMSEDQRQTAIGALIETINEQAKAKGYRGEIVNGRDLMPLSEDGIPKVKGDFSSK